MTLRNFALIYGVVFLVVGIAGFIPGLLMPHEGTPPDLAVDASSGELFGLFPVNAIHNLVHIVFGIWGLAVYRSAAQALLFARSVAVVYAVLAILGLLPGTSTLFGLAPLHGNDVWLHALLAAIAAYFGFMRRAPEGSGATPHGV